MEEALGLELSVPSKAIPEDFVNLSQIIELKLRDSMINIHLNSDPNILDGLGLISSLFSVLNTSTKNTNYQTNTFIEIALLTNLKEFDLSHNSLKQIPDSIGKLKSLTKIDISHNNLEQIPESFGNLKSKNIISVIQKWQLIDHYLFFFSLKETLQI